MKLVQGDTSTYEITIYDGDAVRDLTADTVYLDIRYDIEDTTNILQVTGTVATPTTGEVVFTVVSGDISAIENRIYPYIIYYNDGTKDVFVEKGSATICSFDNSFWEWTFPYYSGAKRTELKDDLISQIPYNSFLDVDIYNWLRTGLERFCRETDYNICHVERLTTYGETDYELPTSLINIIEVWRLDPNSTVENWIKLDSDTDWKQEENKIKFKSSAGFETVADGSEYKIESGQKFKLKASKYSQAMDGDAFFLELPRDAEHAILLYLCWYGKLQDREPEEAKDYENLYKEQEIKFKMKNNKDNEGTVFMTYAGQGDSII